MSSIDTMSLFTDFEEFASLAPAPAPAEEPKKAEKKAEPKKAAKKGKAKTSTKREPGTFKLPITIIGPNFSKEIEGEGEIGEVDLCQKLYEAGIKQAGASFTAITAIDDDKAVLTITGTTADDEDVVDITVPLYVVRGECVMELNAESFDGMEQGEISMADIKAKWVEQYPDFEGCSFMYDPAANIAYPLGSGFKYGDKAVEFRQCDADIADELIISSENDDKLELDAAGKAFLGVDSLPKGVSVSAKMVNKEKEFSKIIIDYKAMGGELAKPFAKTGSEQKIESGEKVEQMVKLPIIIKYPMYDDEELTPEMFGGETKVKLKDIEAYAIKAHPSAYSSTSADFSYKSDWKYVVAGVKSAKKG